MAIKTILGIDGEVIKNNTGLKKVQDILLNQMTRLNDDEMMKTYNKREVARSGALSQQASAYVKSVATQIRILDLSSKYNVEPNDMNEYLGINILSQEEIEKNQAKSKLEKQLDKFNAEREK